MAGAGPQIPKWGPIVTRVFRKEMEQEPAMVLACFLGFVGERAPWSPAAQVTSCSKGSRL